MVTLFVDFVRELNVGRLLGHWCTSLGSATQLLRIVDAVPGRQQM
jgi:hypothetical protein